VLGTGVDFSGVDFSNTDFSNTDRSSADFSTIRIEVSDTGIGIPPEALPRVFDRFFRVDSSRSQGSGGTGLGLAIVQSIALLHGGNVEISSQPGQGTRVTLHMPASCVR
jgi:two-component system heavy metal sensor histidine kinase CusS